MSDNALIVQRPPEGPWRDAWDALPDLREDDETMTLTEIETLAFYRDPSPRMAVHWETPFERTLRRQTADRNRTTHITKRQYRALRRIRASTLRRGLR